MQLTIRNFRGIKSAEIALAPIALVAGPNMAGKSSIAQALAALLLGDPVPLDGLKKSQAAAMIHAGAEKGSITLTGGAEWSATIAYPGAKLQTEGTPPSASRMACGLDSLVWMEPKARADALLGLLKALPTRKDLDAALSKLPVEMTGTLWERIESEGWDGAHAHAKKTGATLKGQWLEVTGEQYGSQKAQSWLPAEWEPDLAGAGEETLNALLVQERDSLEAIIATAAISTAERERLQAKAAGLAQARDAHATATKVHKEAGAALEKALTALEALPKPVDGKPTMECPHCGRPVEVVAGALIAAVPFDEAANIARAQAINEARIPVQEIGLTVREYGAKVDQTARDLESCKAAAAELAAAPAEAPAADIEAARAAVLHAEKRLGAYRAKTRADKLAASVAVNAEVVALLAPDGLRLAKMQSAIGDFNDSLSELCALAGWYEVEVEHDLTITFGGRSYGMLGSRGSERYRTRLVLQVACALCDGSSAVIVDGADVLVGKADRNGLMRMLLEGWKGSALVTLAMPARDAMPALSSPVGRSYWIEGGIIEGGAE